MSRDGLMAYYNRIADAPDAVARLRRFVLDLAVRGRLVAQDGRDQPVLLSRCQDEQTPTAFPPSWNYVRLGDLLREDTRNGYSRRPDDALDGVPILRISAGTVRRDGLVAEEEHKLTSDIDARTRKEYGLAAGDLLACRFNGNKGFVGRLTIFRDYLHLNPIYPDKLIRVRADPQLVLPEFLRAASEADLVRAEIETHCATTVGNWGISASNLKEVRFPVPPVAEQQRIVAKLNEFMALCDQLEAARTEREATRDRLTAASLARLNTPDPGTFPTDARFALDALPALTTRPDQIKQIRQTILNLAVRGKLVPQDGRDQSLPPSSQAEQTPKELPPSWNYVRLRDLLREDTRNGYSRRPDEAIDGVPILRISAGTVRRDGVVAEEEHKLISDINTGTRKEYGLEPDDLLACRFNGNKTFVGRLTIFRDYLGLNPIYPDKLIRVRADSHLALPEFLQAASETDLVRVDVEIYCATTVGNWGISASNLKEVRFPLPPLPEQHRIVAKLTELMTLCDQLEASLTAATTARTRLLEATLREALDPAGVPALKAAE